MAENTRRGGEGSSSSLRNSSGSHGGRFPRSNMLFSQSNEQIVTEAEVLADNIDGNAEDNVYDAQNVYGSNSPKPFYTTLEPPPKEKERKVSGWCRCCGARTQSVSLSDPGYYANGNLENQPKIAYENAGVGIPQAFAATVTDGSVGEANNAFPQQAEGPGEMNYGNRPGVAYGSSSTNFPGTNTTLQQDATTEPAVTVLPTSLEEYDAFDPQKGYFPMAVQAARPGRIASSGGAYPGGGTTGTIGTAPPTSMEEFWAFDQPSGKNFQMAVKVAQAAPAQQKSRKGSTQGSVPISLIAKPQSPPSTNLGPEIIQPPQSEIAIGSQSAPAYLPPAPSVQAQQPLQPKPSFEEINRGQGPKIASPTTAEPYLQGLEAPKSPKTSLLSTDVPSVVPQLQDNANCCPCKHGGPVTENLTTTQAATPPMPYLNQQPSKLSTMGPSASYNTTGKPGATRRTPADSAVKRIQDSVKTQIATGTEPSQGKIEVTTRGSKAEPEVYWKRNPTDDFGILTILRDNGQKYVLRIPVTAFQKQQQVIRSSSTRLSGAPRAMGGGLFPKIIAGIGVVLLLAAVASFFKIKPFGTSAQKDPVSSPPPT